VAYDAAYEGLGLVRSRFLLLALSGLAQESLPVIYLSAGETAKAKQITQEVKSAQDRQTRATTAWKNFYQSYGLAHPELGNVIFSSDFRVAFSVKSSTAQFPIDREAEVVELSTEERQKAESLSREMEEAARAVDQARKNYVDYSYELVADRFPNADGNYVALSSGRTVRLPRPWGGGVAFTPDFRIAVPHY
jgi:hypothetical protein